jgi:hypothetical protein
LRRDLVLNASRQAPPRTIGDARAPNFVTAAGCTLVEMGFRFGPNCRSSVDLERYEMRIAGRSRWNHNRASAIHGLRSSIAFPSMSYDEIVEFARLNHPRLNATKVICGGRAPRAAPAGVSTHRPQNTKTTNPKQVVKLRISAIDIACSASCAVFWMLGPPSGSRNRTVVGRSSHGNVAASMPWA